MVDTSIQAIRAILIQKRDALDNAVRALDAAYDGAATKTAPRTPIADPPSSKRSKVVRTVKPRRAKPAATVRRSLDPLVAAREEAVLSALKRNDGFATSKILRAAMPKEATLTESSQRGAAFRNCVQRLKVKGLIGRTGDTWSLVGRMQM